VWEYLGTVPTVIAWSETYLALQQGLVESVTAPVTLVNDTKFAEVAPYITKTDEYPQTIAFYMNKNKFFTLPEEIRNVLMEACNEAGSEYGRGLDATAAAILKEAETEYKATFVDMDRKPLIEKAQGFYEKAEKEGLMPKEFWDVIAAIEAVRQ
jgi:TRAP-type C4-dicarboxylate transport system substrate-binding protein